MPKLNRTMRVPFALAVGLTVACDGQNPIAPDAAELDSHPSILQRASPNEVTKPFRGSLFLGTIQSSFTPCVEIPGFPPPDPSLCASRCPGVTPTLVSSLAARGHATHFGDFFFSQQHCTVLTFGPVGPVRAEFGLGEFTLTAANGDMVTGTYGSFGANNDGLSVPVPDQPGVFSFSEKLVFTGGTGRFVNASGYSWDTGRFLGSGEIIEWSANGSITYAASNVAGGGGHP